MKAQIIEKPVTVYSDASVASTPLTRLPVGSEVEIGKFTWSGGIKWISVLLGDGRRGYVFADTKVFALKRAKLLQSAADVHLEPSVESTVINRFEMNDVFEKTGMVITDRRIWVKVRDPAGREGFIAGDTLTDDNPPIAVLVKKAAQRNMAMGGCICIVGIVITWATINQPSVTGGYYFVAWGPIIFGGLQFFRGLFQSMNSAD